MKFLLLLFLLLPVASQGKFVNYVWAKDGLTLRDAPSKTGKKLAVLPYGTEIDSIISYAEADSILMIPRFDKCRPYYLKGTWMFVHTNGVDGYVFGGMLSQMVPYQVPTKAIESYRSDIGGYLGQISKLSCYSKRPDRESYQTSVFDNGAIEVINCGSSGCVRSYTIDLMSYDDAILLMNYFEDIFYKEVDFAAVKGESNPYVAFTFGEMQSPAEYSISERFLIFESQGLPGKIWYSFSIRQITGSIMITIVTDC